MRVTMRGDISGTRDGVDWPARGGFVDLPDDEAAQLVANGMAIEGQVDLATGAPLITATLADDDVETDPEPDGPPSTAALPDDDVETAESPNASAKPTRARRRT